MSVPDAGTAPPVTALEAFELDRLPHVLPDFTRVSWVSDRARGVWEPRIARVGAAWSQIEWQSVVSGIRRCTLISVMSEQLVPRTAEWAGHGLSAMPVAMSGTSPGYASTSIAPRVGEPFEYRVAIGALTDVAALKEAMDAGDDSTMGALLGFPECCIEFFRKTWVEESCVDTTWAMAARSARPDATGRLIEISADMPFQANILWRWIGPRAVPHLPCSFGCRATVDFANRLMTLGRTIGFAAEMDWLEEILNWPASWSGLHGIAEIKTPVLKASTRTDATAHEFIVRRHGRRLPEETPAGLVFPFRTPERPGTTHTLAFRKGLEAPIAINQEPPAWYASDNGFSARAAMDEAHRPIVELAVSTLGATGTVIDLGCGNGALLKKIAEARPGVVPFGVDTDETKLEHARLLQPAFGANFVAGNMFERIPLDADTVYSLVILMPGRLLEVNESSRCQLREWLRGHFQQLLVYGYGDWLTRYEGLAGLAARAGLTVVTLHFGGTAGLARFAD
ncbi:MAG TPA: class I SAM-dependent methyltransferase [Vicinamibacterales bacterium]|nr:class I SAM-dependent methyltransferase [Vicinamibacterales bacterium]